MSESPTDTEHQCDENLPPNREEGNAENSASASKPVAAEQHQSNPGAENSAPDPDMFDAALDGNAEAAKWRRKLRDAETERDTLAAQVEQIQRSQVESLLERENVTFDGLTALGATLADLCDSGGCVDADKVHQAAERARDVLGISLHQGLFVPAEGKIPPAPATGSFTAAFAPKENRK